MATSVQAKALSLARSQVGYTEQRVNRTKYWAELYPAFQGQAWCAAFVVWCYKHAGFDLRSRIPSPYYCPSIESWARRNGWWKTSGQKNGDLVLYGTGSAAHVGMVWRDEKASGKRAVEGNTSSGSGGSQSNGGGVYVRYRSSWIRGYVDMGKVLKHYGATNAKPEKVKPSKPAVVNGKLTVDGRWGKATTKAIQKRLGVKVDGRAGSDTWRAFRKAFGMSNHDYVSYQSYKATELGNGIVPNRWKYTGRGSKGSPFIKRLQKEVGVKADGICGSGTIKALQKKLNGDAKWLKK